MNNIHFPLTHRRMVASAVALIAIVAAAVSVAEHRANVHRLHADIRLIDSATAQLASH